MTQSVHSNCIRIFKQPHWLGLVLLLLVSTGHAHGGISAIGGLFYIYLAVMVLGAITTLWLGFFIWLLCNQVLSELAIKWFRWLVYVVLAMMLGLLLWMSLDLGWDGMLVAMALGVSLGVVIITELEILLGRNWRH